MEEINEFLQEEMLRTSHTVLKLDELKKIVSMAKSSDKQVVFTNGCFDIIHGGHNEFLQKAKSLGDILIVGLNTDQSVSGYTCGCKAWKFSDDKLCKHVIAVRIFENGYIKKGIVDNIVSMSLSRDFTNEEIYDLINR